MLSTVRTQQRYDHRLRELVQNTGDATLATELGVPRSTARGWLGAPAMVVLSLCSHNGWAGSGRSVDLVPPGATVWAAAASPPCPASEAEDRPACDAPQ